MSLTFIIIIGAVLFFLNGIKIVRPTHRGLIERLGKYNRFANPGFHWIFPVVELMYQVNTTEQMVNAHNTCHGGAIFTLADSTFGYACNSHNQNALAASCSIEYLAPAYLGEVLTAVGVEQARAGRQGIYDMRVTNHRGELIALFRGKSVTVRGHLVEVQ